MQVLLNDIGNTVIDEVLLYPHCLIEVQWGKLTKTSWDTFSGNFPIAFNICYAAIGVANDTGYTGCSFNNKSINVRSRWESSNASNISTYLAIGK